MNLLLRLLVLLLAASASARAAKPPNILFVIADDWGLHAGAYGTGWVQTPHFDRVAKDGILFQNAYTPNAKCGPSRSCLLTGRNSWQLKAAANHWAYFQIEFKTWAEALRENGWQTGQTGKGWAPGVARDAAGKNRSLIGPSYDKRQADPPTKGISRNDYAANFDDFLDQASPEKPWAFWSGSLEPHRDYEFGSGVSKGGKKISEIDRVPGFWPDTPTVREDMLDYAYEVEHFDRHLGRMLASLEKRGLLENTLVIVTSDHGMPFPRGKGGAYESSNHVPFAAMWPGGIKGTGRTVTDYISFIDLAPTLLDLADLPWEKSGMASTPGRSLAPLFSSGQSGRINPGWDHVLIGMERHDVGRPGDAGYPIRGMIQEQVVYLENIEPSRWPACNPETGYLNVDGGATKTVILQNHRSNPSDPFWALCFGKRPPVEFYDLRTDRDCLTNLAGTKPVRDREAAMKSQLHRELAAQEDPRESGQGYVFDDYPYADPSGAHFYERFLRGEKLRPGWVSPGDFEKPKAGDFKGSD